jgi:uncharacterized protein DUF1572
MPAPAPPGDIARHVLDDALATFRSYRKLAEQALEQVGDEAFFFTPDAESNSIALIVKHVGGNLRSRWTDVLTTDGEKPDRHRDDEFLVAGTDTRDHLMGIWRRGWDRAEETVASLQPADVMREITIRGKSLTVLQAFNRSLTHVAYHVGQIVYEAKHLRGEAWKNLSIPRGKSAEYAKG